MGTDYNGADGRFRLNLYIRPLGALKKMKRYNTFNMTHPDSFFPHGKFRSNFPGDKGFYDEEDADEIDYMICRDLQPLVNLELATITQRLKLPQ